tara:strand:+ start:867 stop:1076 length:210 start_codon:yes stop_codon:yes gene_type:complete
MKPHIKVIQRNGVDIFVTSSMTMKCTKSEQAANRAAYMGMQGVQGAMGGAGGYAYDTNGYIAPPIWGHP